ncbi:MAG: hypothetical protein LBE75_01915 [Burkholderiales bacterium]|jgi:hypothetical protein|nr:hypothetical protein [Burkholderiales bacterium]
MFKFLRSLLSKGQPQPEHYLPAVQQAPTEIVVEGMLPLVLTKHLNWHNGFPIPNWSAIYSWLDTITEESKKRTAYRDCERAWLLHFAAALGADCRLSESENAMVLSSAEPNVVKAKLAFMERTLKSISSMLNGLAEIPVDGKDVLIVFDEQDDYYRYVFCYYPEDGEFAQSSGMYISAGCCHFVTVKGDLTQMEPTIVHEMTHACLAHLHLLPRWVDEGLAVNVEKN